MATVHLNRAAATTLALAALSRAAVSRLHAGALPTLFRALFDSMKVAALGGAIALNSPVGPLHPGGMLVQLCFHMDLRLRDTCAEQVIAGLQTAKLTQIAEEMRCLIMADGSFIPLSISLFPWCAFYYEATYKPASGAAERYFPGTDLPSAMHCSTFFVYS
jgi:hypothetical protein